MSSGAGKTTGINGEDLPSCCITWDNIEPPLKVCVLMIYAHSPAEAITCKLSEK